MISYNHEMLTTSILVSALIVMIPTRYITTKIIGMLDNRGKNVIYCIPIFAVITVLMNVIIISFLMLAYGGVDI